MLTKKKSPGKPRLCWAIKIYSIHISLSVRFL